MQKPGQDINEAVDFAEKEINPPQALRWVIFDEVERDQGGRVFEIAIMLGRLEHRTILDAGLHNS